MDFFDDTDQNPEETGPSPMRTIKDSVFRDLFSQPEYLLQLYQTLHPEDTAATEADLGNVTIRICRDRNILKTYLEAREPEVITIMQTLFSQEQVTKMYGRRRWREGRAEGLAEGKAEGRAEGEQRNARKNAFQMKKMGFENSVISEALNISEEQLSAWYAEGPDFPEDEA